MSVLAGAPKALTDKIPVLRLDTFEKRKLVRILHLRLVKFSILTRFFILVTPLPLPQDLLLPLIALLEQSV